MGQISMATRNELVVALAGRYATSNRKERGQILDEFAVVSGLHRKHACDCSARAGPAAGPGLARNGAYIRRRCNEAVREALTVIWEASDRVRGKRLRPLVPILVEAMERHGHLQLAPEVRASLAAMSAATIDRALRDARQPGGGRKRRNAPPSAAIRATFRCELLTAGTIRRQVTAIHATLDPVQLLRSIRAAQQELVEIADRPVTDEATPPTAPTAEQFLAGLRTAWRESEVRPSGLKPSHGGPRAICSSACKHSSLALSPTGNCGRCNAG